MGVSFKQEDWYLQREDYTIKGTLWIPEVEERRFLGFPLKPKPSPLVVLHHGIISNRLVFAEYAGLLASEGFLCLTYDARAHGWTGGPIDFPSMVDDLEAVIESLHEDYAPETTGILGHSMGGWVSAVTASKCPLVDAVATISGAVDPLNDFIMMYPQMEPAVKILKSIVKRLDKRNLSIQLPPSLFSSATPGKKVLRAMQYLIFGSDEPTEIPGLADYSVTNLCKAFLAWPDAKEYVLDITIPYITFHGTADDVVPCLANEQIFEAVGTGDKTRHVFEGGTHDIRDTHYEEISPRVLEFFKQYLS